MGSTIRFKSRLKDLAPVFLRRFSRRTKAAIHNWPNRRRTAKEVFGQVYAAKMWGSDNEKFYSGPGSNSEAAKPYTDFIANLITEHNVKSVVDLGCGDFRVGQLVASCGVNYTGVDVVQALVEENIRRYGSDTVSFQCLDITSDDLPDGELCLIREVFQHLSNAQIGAALAKLQKYRLVLVTDVQPEDAGNCRINRDKVHGASSRLVHESVLRLDAPPFNLKNVELVFETGLVDFAYDGLYGSNLRMRTFLLRPAMAASASSAAHAVLKGPALDSCLPQESPHFD